MQNEQKKAERYVQQDLLEQLGMSPKAIKPRKTVKPKQVTPLTEEEIKTLIEQLGRNFKFLYMLRTGFTWTRSLHRKYDSLFSKFRTCVQ